MRTIIIGALLATAAFGLSAEKTPYVNSELVAQLNAIEGKTWTASENNGLVTGATRAELKRLLGAKRGRPSTLPKRQFTEKELAMAIPDAFDSATNWPQCSTISYIWDQSECGSCWAVAGAGAMSDRLCTSGTNKRVQFLSARDLLSCCTSCGDGCDGGWPDAAWSYWVRTGLHSEECQPYPFPHCDHHTTGKYPPCGQNDYPTPTCVKSACTGNSTAASVAIVKGATSYSLAGEAAFQRELMTNGPFEVAFDVYGDFMTYKAGVYSRTSSDYLGGHAVRIVGWGSLNGVKYWKIANSWNEDWGMDGYFLIKRGDDECGIEDEGSAGLAQ